MPPRDLPKALLVDLDDTLVDDSSGNAACWEEAAALVERRGLPVGPGEFRAALRAAIDHHWSDPERHRLGRLDLPAARRTIVEEALRSLGRPDRALAHAVADRYSELRRESTRPIPGAREALAALRERGVRMVMVTNGHPSLQRLKIDRFGLAGFFEGILIEGEVGFGKPDERVYGKALDLLGVGPGEAGMVGDNFEWEVVAPARLGLFTAWVDHRGRGVPADAPARPDRVVRTFAELLD